MVSATCAPSPPLPFEPTVFTKTQLVLCGEQPHEHVCELTEHPESISLTMALAQSKMHAERHAAHPHKNLTKQGLLTLSWVSRTRPVWLQPRHMILYPALPQPQGRERTF